MFYVSRKNVHFLILNSSSGAVQRAGCGRETLYTMTDNLVLDEAEEAVHVQNEPFEISDFPQTLVTEKIIFVIDILLLVNDVGDNINIDTIFSLFKCYFSLKKKICVKPLEFECLLYNNKTIIHSYINSVKDLGNAFREIQNGKFEDESYPLEIDKVFDKIANLVELPDPGCAKNLPPEWVYHVVWLFGRNLSVPTMENTNSFDYLMMTPYFALDILYLYNTSVESHQCEQISQALSGLNENNKGYFLLTSVTMKAKLFSCFAQFLGHPLIRVPQFKARFNILELGPQVDITECNNSEE